MKIKHSLSDKSMGSFAMSAGIEKQFIAASRRMVDLHLALAKDTTKTPKLRELHYLKSHELELDKISSLIKSKRDNITTAIDGLKKRVDAESKIKGTTDTMILQGHANAIQSQGINAAKVVEMAMKSGNSDGIRALLLSPVAMYADGYESQHQFLFESLEKMTLGDDYENLAELKRKQTALNKLDFEVFNQYKLVTDDKKAIEAKIVPPVAA